MKSGFSGLEVKVEEFCSMVTEIVKVERQQLALRMERIKRRFLKNAIIADDRFCCYVRSGGWLSLKVD